MTVRATDILKEIQKLNPAEKQRLRAFLIDTLTDKGMTIYQFKSDGKVRTKSLYPIQNVNSYHSRLKG